MGMFKLVKASVPTLVVAALCAFLGKSLEELALVPPRPVVD